MKKILIILVCFNLIFTPAFCAVIESNNIIDEFAETSLDKNLRIKNSKTPDIIDDFAENNTRKNNSSKPNLNCDEKIPVVSNSNKTTKKIALINEDDFIPIKIRIKDKFSTKDTVDEGDYINFETLEDIKIKDTIYNKGTIVKARIETISKNKTQGVPADLTVGNFSLDNNMLQGEINKTGANRSLWLYPTICVGNIFFGAGMLLMFIRGGHAKINPKETFTVYLLKN